MPSRFRLATPRLILWAYSHTSRRCDSAVHSGLAQPLNHPGRFRAPWPPPTCARLSRPSDIPALPPGPSGCSGSAGLSHVFRRVPVQSLSASRHPEHWREPTTLLSIAIGVVIRRRAQVCTLPLNRSGRIRAPWPPTSCARLPLQLPGELYFPMDYAIFP